MLGRESSRRTQSRSLDARVQPSIEPRRDRDPACTFVMTGNEVPGKPSLGSWLSYGLGSQSEDLPAFVVLTPSWSANAMAQALFTRMWSSGFLPTQ